MKDLIKKLLDLFLGNEEEDEAGRKTRTTAVYERQPEVKARVTYQYPKGNFRFPVIPDDVVEMSPPQPKRKNTNENNAEIVERPKQKKSKKIIKTEKGKFTPSTVPSPIHGYQFPKQDSIDEHKESEEIHEAAATIESENKAEHNEHAVLAIAEKKQEDQLETKRHDESQTIELTADVENRSQMEQNEEIQTIKVEQYARKPEQIEAETQSEFSEKTSAAEAEQFTQEIKQLEEPEISVTEAAHAHPTVTESDIIMERLTQEPKIAAIGEEHDNAARNIESASTVETDQFMQEAKQINEPQLMELAVENENPTLAELSESAVALEREQSVQELQYAETAATRQNNFFTVDRTSIIEAEEIEQDEYSQLALDEDEADQFSFENKGSTEEIKNADRDGEQQKLQHPISHRSKPSKPIEQTIATANIPYNVIMLSRDRKAQKNKSAAEKEYATTIPPIHLLNDPPPKDDSQDSWLEEQKELLDTTLANFNVGAKVVNATQGPSVTRFEVQPNPGVKVNKITNLVDDIKLSLAAKDIRMEAPIPGKNAIGIEVPNLVSQPVFIHEIINDPVFQNSKSPLTVSLGLDIGGNPIVTDLKKMPHGLIAGATGSGKSVCINSIIVSILFKAEPHEVKLLLIDPKMVELAPYNEIPHLVSPVITDVKAATGALKWAVEEMERRYELFAHSGVRDIDKYNEKVKSHDPKQATLPYLVIIIDELADLMMVAPNEVEEAICRIAQKARACGIHLLLATQRPSVDVITGLIKANVPTRIAFSVSSQIDSRTIIDINGAEKLLGKGDMLFLENGSPKPIRIQGNFVSDEEIERVTAYVKEKMKPTYLFEQEELLQNNYDYEMEDELFDEACAFVFEQDAASVSSLQRRFHIGYNRAARLIDMMEARGIISEAKGSKPRDVLISKDVYYNSENK